MKLTTIFLMVLLSALSLANAIHVLDEVHDPKVVQFGLEKRAGPGVSHMGLTSQFSDMGYSFDYTLGTPPQQIQSVFDIGSSDLIVNIPNSDKCGKTPQTCLSGVYNPVGSTTKNDLSGSVSSQHSIGQCSGSRVVDTLNFGGSIIPKFAFGICNVSSVPFSYWGFGYSNGVAETTLETFVAAGLIKSASVSFQLADPANFILGGLDTNAFSGNLIGFPIIPDIDGSYDGIALNVAGIFVNGTALYTSEYPFRAVFDTGSFENRFPSDMTHELWDAYTTSSISLPDSSGMGNVTFALCNCGLSRSTDVMKIDFHGFYVELTIGDLVQQVPGTLSQALGISIPPGQCIFNVNVVKGDGKGGSPFVLGSSFLKHIYTVIDFESNLVAMGKLSVSAGLSPSIREIGSGVSGLSEAEPYMIIEERPHYTVALGSQLVPGYLGCLVVVVIAFILVV